MKTRLSIVILAVCVGLACSDDDGSKADASVTDGGRDIAVDVSSDIVTADKGPHDAAPDAGVDSAVDTTATDTISTGLVISAPNSEGLALAGTTLIYSTQGEVRSCDANNCAATDKALLTGLVAPSQVATDGADVYFSSSQPGGKVSKCALAGCSNTPTELTDAQDWPGGVAVDATHFYFSTAVSNGGVYRCPKAGCVGSTPQTIASAQGFPQKLAVHGGDVYWGSFTDKKIYKCPITGCSSSIAVVIDAVEATTVFVDGTLIYWVDEMAGKLLSCTLAGCGGSPTTLQSGLATPKGLVVDATYVYWSTDDAAGGVYRALK